MVPSGGAMECNRPDLAPGSFGQIVGDSFKTYFTDIATYTLIAAIVIVPVALCSGALWALGDFAVTAADDWSSNLSKWMVTELLFPAGTVLITLLAYPLMHGALIHATARKRLGQPIDIGQAYFSAFRKSGKLVGAQLVVTLLLSAMMVSLICLAFALSLHITWLYILTAVLAMGLPFALYFAIKWLFVLQTVMLEGRPVTQTIPRSSDLVTGNWRRTFGIWTLFAVILPFAGGCVSMILLAVGGRLGVFAGSGVFGAMVFLSIFPTLVVLPLSTVAQTLVYFDLRVRREQYSLDTLAKELGQGSAEAPPAAPDHVPQTETTHARQPGSLNPILIAVASLVLLLVLVPPAAILVPQYANAGDIQVSVKSASTGKETAVGHGSLKTIGYTDFALVVDFNSPVEIADQANTIESDIKWWGDEWRRISARVRVFAQEETKEHFLASGLIPENDPANEVSVTVERLGEERILVSPVAGEFPSGSQLVLYLDLGGGSGYSARLFTL